MTKASDSSNTRDIIGRLYRKHRKTLLNKAASFFASQRTKLGLDAESLLHEAIATVLHNGFPSNTDNHLAYLMKTIERQGIQRVHRRMETDDTPKTRRAKARLSPTDRSSGVEESVIDRLERDLANAKVRSAIETLPANVRRVAKAKMEYPDISDAEIARTLEVSRSTVARAKRFMREDPALRYLASEASLDRHNGNQPPSDRRRTP